MSDKRNGQILPSSESLAFELAAIYSSQDSERGPGMLEAEASADMLLMTQPFPAPTTTERPEAVLVRAVLNGERDRFARLYEMYAPMVHGILLARVPRGEVDDLVQDSFLHALRKLHTLRY